MAESGPIGAHDTETSDRPWSGPKAQKKLGDDERKLRQAHGWVDGDADPSTKSAYKFIHHEVAGDGSVGPANVRAAASAIGVLNGARGGANIPEKDRRRIYNHLAQHLNDAGKEPPPLK